MRNSSLQYVYWNIIKQSIKQLLNPEDVSDMGLDQWFQPILNDYLCNGTMDETRKCIVLYLIKEYLCKQFIPNLPANEYHLLQKKDEHKLKLAELMFHEQPISIYLTLRYNGAYNPFLCTLDLNCHAEFVLKTFVIGNQTIHLSKHRWVRPEPQYDSYIMGNEISPKYYSYLPMFRKLVESSNADNNGAIQVELNYSNNYCN